MKGVQSKDKHLFVFRCVRWSEVPAKRVDLSRAIGGDTDYAMLVKVYGPAPEGEKASLVTARQFATARRSIGLKGNPEAYQHVNCGAQQSFDPHGQPQDDEVTTAFSKKPKTTLT